MRKLIITLTLIFSVYLSLSGQSAQLINETRELFPDVKNIISVELYGYLGNENEVQLYLAYDENEWRGFCYYPASNTKIKVEGGIVRNNLILDETDGNDMKIGMWMIGIDQIDHPAKWRDISGKVSFDLILRKLNDANKAMEYRHSYCSIYEGTIDDQSYQLKTYINHGNNLRTSLMNYGKMFYYPSIPECIDPGCTTYKLVINSEEGINEIVFSPVSHKLIKALVKYDGGTQREVSFNETGFIQLNEISYMSSFYRIYVSYPILKDLSINDTIKRDISAIMDTLRKELDACVENEDELNSRLTVSANGWFDLGLVNDDIYSGVLTIQSDCTDKIRTYSLVYNVKTGQKIDFGDQFTEGFNIKFFFSQYLKEKIKKIPEFKTPIFKNHLKPESFRNLYVSDQGIVFATDFNTILGSQRIILPFTDLKGVIKRKSPLKKMVND